MINLYLTTGSQLAQNDTRFIINQDVALAGDVSIGSGCILSFQGGRLINGLNPVSTNDTITVTGNDTVIEANLTEIFGKDIDVAGSWIVKECYPDWFYKDNSVDDLPRFEKAIKLLNSRGGELRLLGPYQLSGTLMVPRYIKLVGYSYSKSVIMAKENFAAASGEANGVICFENVGNGGQIDKCHGIGGKNFTINCQNQNCHGLIMQYPYDDVIFENVMVTYVGRNYSAFRVLNVGASVGQTILMLNCYGTKTDRYTSIPEVLSKSQPVFYFRGINEASLIGCKAFGSYGSSLNSKDLKTKIKESLQNQPINDNPECAYIDMPDELGGSCYCFEDCRGITLEGCSSANSLSSIEINAETKASVGFMISGHTNEWIYVYDLYTYGNLSGNNNSSPYNTVNDVTLTPLRRQNGGGTIMLRYCSDSFIVYPSYSQVVLLDGHGNEIHSVRPVNSYKTVIEPTPENPNPEQDPNVYIAPAVPYSNCNVLIPSKNARVSNGFRVANRLYVYGDNDNTHTERYANIKESLSVEMGSGVGRVAHNGNERVRFENGSLSLVGSNAYLKFSAPANAQSTGIDILRTGIGNTQQSYPVVMCDSTVIGRKTLTVQTDNSADVPTAGTFAQAPTTSIVAGFCYFATDLNKPVWWDGNQYRDAVGNVIS